jgi:hypothetical protein
MVHGRRECPDKEVVAAKHVFSGEDESSDDTRVWRRVRRKRKGN